LLRVQVPHAAGYREAAAYVAARAPAHSAILFNGYYNGSFTFNMRTHGEGRDLWTLRGDKLFLKITVSRDRGLEELPVPAAAMSEMMNRLGVTYVVHEPGYMNDLKVMREFESLLHSSQFRLVSTIPTETDGIRGGQRVDIYENLAPMNHSPEHVRLDLPIIGISIEGAIRNTQPR